MKLATTARPARKLKRAPPAGSVACLPAAEAGRSGPIGNAIDPLRPATGRRGGARNRRDRASLGLTARQVLGLLAAAAHAERTGLPLNRHVTVHWEALGVADGLAGAATGRLLKRMKDWAGRRGFRFACIWVREGDRASGKGGHVHILAHVPAEQARAFAGRGQVWLRLETGRRPPAGAWRSRPVGPRADSYRASPAFYRVNTAVILGYLCKGALPEVAEALGLERRRPGGVIIGKRAGWSECLGEAARRRLGEAGGEFLDTLTRAP